MKVLQKVVITKVTTLPNPFSIPPSPMNIWVHQFIEDYINYRMNRYDALICRCPVYYNHKTFPKRTYLPSRRAFFSQVSNCKAHEGTFLPKGGQCLPRSITLRCRRKQQLTTALRFRTLYIIGDIFNSAITVLTICRCLVYYNKKLILLYYNKKLILFPEYLIISITLIRVYQATIRTKFHQPR